MSSEPAISVSAVSKVYRTYARPIHRLKQAAVGRAYRFSRALDLRMREPRYFREFAALTDVSFQVHRGECLGILGRNGAGKSTLLEIIAGTLAPTAGEVRASGRIGALLELGSGFSGDFTGRENVLLSAALLGMNRREIEERLPRIEEFAEIGEFIDRPVKTYSSGMVLRLAFSVHVALEPSIMIVDEALAVGDARFQKRCYDRLNSFRRGGGTVLFVTHDMHLTAQLCDRAMILEKGEIYDQGEPGRLVREYHRLLFGSARTFDRIERPSTPNGPSATLSSTALPAPSIDSKELRYGSGHAVIRTMELRNENQQPTKVIVTGAVVEFVLTVEYQVEIEDRIAYGFIITNTRGIEVYGTKSGFFDDYLPTGRAGSKFECKLKMPVFLVPGVYFVTAALAASQPLDGNAYLDCRFDALEFEVVGNPRCFTTSIVDLGGKLSHEAT